MNTPSKGFAITVVSSLMFVPFAFAQTTSPRNLQAPTMQELLKQCEREKAADRQACEKRVREGGIPTEGTRNKPASEQREPAIESREATDPGRSAVPPKFTGQDDPSARTRDTRTRMSQRSNEVNSKPQVASEPNPTISTDAAATESGAPRPEQPRSARSADAPSADSRRPQSPTEQKPPAKPENKKP
jgi:hypothetical protein